MAFRDRGLYVWLLVARRALPCSRSTLAGWRPVLRRELGAVRVVSCRAASGDDRPSSSAVFPLLAWQLLFVHGIAIGYHRDAISAFVARLPESRSDRRRHASRCSWSLRCAIRGQTDRRGCTSTVVSPELFTYLYEHFFSADDRSASGGS